MLRSVLRRRLLALFLALAGVVWLVADKYFEGPVLLVLTPHHGITASDLVSLPLFGAAIRLSLVRSRRESGAA
jgi:hypothetical protein